MEAPLPANRFRALHFAVIRGESEIVKELIAAGAQVDAPDITAYTPLHYAALYVNQEVAQTLLEAGAAADARNDQGETPADSLRKAQQLGRGSKKEYDAILALLASNGKGAPASTAGKDSVGKGKVR